VNPRQSLFATSVLVEPDYAVNMLPCSKAGLILLREDTSNQLATAAHRPARNAAAATILVMALIQIWDRL